MKKHISGLASSILVGLLSAQQLGLIDLNNPRGVYWFLLVSFGVLGVSYIGSIIARLWRDSYYD